jgi:hypothetical protein
MQILETEHGTQGFYLDITPVHRSIRVIIDQRWVATEKVLTALLGNEV